MAGLFYFRQVIIVADSGSTKTDWIAVDAQGNELHRVWTEGYNPMIVGSDYVYDSLKKSDLDMIANRVEKVFFYGAGCSSDDKNAVIEKPMKAFFFECAR